MVFSKLSLLATFAASASAYDATHRTFAVNHFYGDGPLVSGRMDPIVSPGVAAGHVHAIQGGSNFALTMGDTTALESNCTSSLVKNDKSNYWTPSLYFQDPKNGSLTAVPMFYMNVYYFFEATTDKITAFQPGHRMLVGNPSLRTPPASGGASIVDKSQGTPQPVQFTCPRASTSAPLYPPTSNGLNGAGIQDPENDGAGVGFPDQDCDGYASPLRADIHFPSCYNPAAGLDNYKENMDWPTNGNCPEGWVHTPHIFYEVYWNTPLFKDLWTQGQGTQPFVLAMGDPTGYGLHGDFISGWDVETLQQIIDNCNAGDKGMDKCPGLIGGLNDPSTTCNIPSAINEVITGTMDKLPGNNPIGQWGVTVASSSVKNTTSPSVSVSVSVPAVASSIIASASNVVGSAASSVAGIASSIISVSDDGSSSSSAPSSTVASSPIVSSSVESSSVESSPAASSPTASSPSTTKKSHTNTGTHTRIHTTVSPVAVAGNVVPTTIISANGNLVTTMVTEVSRIIAYETVTVTARDVVIETEGPSVQEMKMKKRHGGHLRRHVRG